jgi:hypothetical protein
MVIGPDISQLTTQPAELVTRNAAGAVASRVSAIRARKLDQAAMNELIELVNDLIADKNELIGLATAFEQELVAQRISSADIVYITTRLLPVVEQLTSSSGGDEESREALEAIKNLVSTETLTIMQLVGFNFRRAIGEPADHRSRTPDPFSSPGRGPVCGHPSTATPARDRLLRGVGRS